MPNEHEHDELISNHKPRAIHSPAEALRASEERCIEYFDVPKKLLPISKGITRMGFVELTPREEMNASKRCHGDMVRLAWELAKECLRVLVVKQGEKFVDQHVSTSDGTMDAVWTAMHPKVRALATTAYGSLHNPTEEDAEGFLGSRRSVAG